MPLDEQPSNPFSVNANEPHAPGLLARARSALLAPIAAPAFPTDTTTGAVTGDVDHGPQNDASARTPEARPQVAPPPTPANREAAEPQLARLLVDALAAVRELGMMLAPAPIGPGAHLNTRAVSAYPTVRIAAATSPQLVFPKNSGRRGFTVYSEPTTSIAYLGLCEPNSLTTLNYLCQIQPGQLYELPGPPYYGGVVAILFAGTTGSVVATELA